MAGQRLSTMASMRCVLAVLAHLARHALCLHLSGSLPASGTFDEYVGKFCFDYVPDGQVGGTLEVAVSGSLPETNLYFLIFDDEPQHWRQARGEWGSLKCEDMISLASNALPVSSPEGKFITKVDVHERLRPRFWYFAFVACGSSITEAISYDLKLLNPRQGLQQEFGVDEEGTLQLQSTAAAFFLCLAVGMWYAAIRSGSRSGLRSRPILRLLLLSAASSAVGAMCRTLHLAAFAFDGQGWGLLDVLGQLCICAAKAMIALVMLLAAKGWSLFYGRDEFTQRCTTLCILGLLLVTAGACEIHADWARDWSPSLYQYESWSGTLVLVLNMLLFMEASRSMYATYRKESAEELRTFYQVVTGAASVYFLSLPVLCTFASLLAPWVRFKYVDRIEVLSRFAATVLLALSLKPSRLDAMITWRLEEQLEQQGVLDSDEDKLSSGSDRDYIA